MDVDRCGRCSSELVGLDVDDAVEVAGHTFRARLPARSCPKCGDILIEGHDLQALEHAAILALAHSGERSAATLRALRKAAELTTARLADLLDVSNAMVLAWEDGSTPIPAAQSALLRAFAISKLGGPEQPVDEFSLLRRPKNLGNQVRLYVPHVEAAPRMATA
jgi:DNA-binding transcriptional regulator YiaG